MYELTPLPAADSVLCGPGGFLLFLAGTCNLSLATVFIFWWKLVK